ncbi:heptaprenyl diphosphate synthase component 1 [Virgibacillus profundi]|uniref:heptaprenyl diphosphate synthase component 1 n=1 Tax=Virgibacillus profundi TaxID=2024555 RepID=UPI0013FDBFAC|nr:heptaprenyl diphosphate synthase component 1 [Virgibacillus profundi]
MNTSSLDIKHLKASIEDKIQHTYLIKHIQQPIIDEEKLFILAAIINNAALSTFQKERYIITTMLVQVALDTHDLVPKANEIDETKELKLSKQLRVLAGDYYSGLYYLLLSEIEDFDLIHKLASAIKEINEYKMKLYYKEVNSFQEYIDIIKKIESLLILYVAEHVNENSLHDVTGEWLITNKLIQEKENVNRDGYSNLLDNWDNNNSNSTYSSILNTIDTFILKYTQTLEKSLLKLPIHQRALKTHINSQLKGFLYNNTSIAEEG